VRVRLLTRCVCAPVLLFITSQTVSIQGGGLRGNIRLPGPSSSAFAAARSQAGYWVAGAGCCGWPVAAPRLAQQMWPGTGHPGAWGNLERWDAAQEELALSI